jgi:hypothetical protein
MKVDRSSASVLSHLVTIVQVVADHLRNTRKKKIIASIIVSKQTQIRLWVLQDKEASKNKEKK